MREQDIIAGCLRNEIAAQRELYNIYSPRMLSVCFRYAYRQADAEDMLQDGFLKIFSQLENFENKGAFEGWIRTIMVHTCINFLKKTKKFEDHIEISNAYEYPGREETVFSVLHSNGIVDCIRMLPIGYRTVLNLFAIEGYTHKEIASILEIEESTSRSQYTRAKLLLETILIDNHIIEHRNGRFGLSLVIKQ